MHSLKVIESSNEKVLLNTVVKYFKDIFIRYIKNEITLDELVELLNYEKYIQELSIFFPGKAHDIKGLIVLVKNIIKLSNYVDESELKSTLQFSVLTLDKLLLDEVFFKINEVFYIVANIAKLTGLKLYFTFGDNEKNIKGKIVVDSNGFVLSKESTLLKLSSCYNELSYILTSSKEEDKLYFKDLEINYNICPILIRKLPIGRITLNTFKNAKEAGASDIFMHIFYNNGNTIVKVRDNGSGMNNSTIKNVLFKKGVTTKGNVGEGVGMYELAKTILLNGGGIHIFSNNGKEVTKYSYNKNSVFADNIIPNSNLNDNYFNLITTEEYLSKGTTYLFVCECKL